MPRKSSSKPKRVADMSITELVQQTERRIEEISRQRVAEVRALFDQVLERTQLSIREVYGQVKGQVSDAVNKVASEWDAGVSSAKTKVKTASSSGRQKGARGPAKGMKLAPKYRHPEHPELTWAGRGAQPVWLREEISNGADIESFRIDVASHGAGTKSKTKRRAKAVRKAKAK